MFEVGDIVKCVNPGGPSLKHGQLYIIAEINDKMINDQFGVVTQLVKVMYSITLQFIERVYFASRFKSV